MIDMRAIKRGENYLSRANSKRNTSQTSTTRAQQENDIGPHN